MGYDCIWFTQYISDWTNKFDFIIGLLFIIMMAIRFTFYFVFRQEQCIYLYNNSDGDIPAIPFAAFQSSDSIDQSVFDQETCNTYHFTYNDDEYIPECLDQIEMEITLLWMNVH